MEYFLILTLINDHFEIFTYDAKDYDEAIQKIADGIVYLYVLYNYVVITLK